MSSYPFAGIVHAIVEDSKSILEDLLYSDTASRQLSASIFGHRICHSFLMRGIYSILLCIDLIAFEKICRYGLDLCRSCYKLCV
jgi:hypothetical protein